MVKILYIINTSTRILIERSFYHRRSAFVSKYVPELSSIALRNQMKLISYSLARFIRLYTFIYVQHLRTKIRGKR